MLILLFDVFMFLDCAFCKWQENNCVGMWCLHTKSVSLCCVTTNFSLW